VNGQMALNSAEFAFTSVRRRQLITSTAFYAASLSELTFSGDRKGSPTKVVPFPSGALTIAVILIDQTTLLNGDTILFISSKQSHPTSLVTLQQNTPSNAGNLECPTNPTLAPGEGMLLEFFDGYWYCIEHQRIV
jgi:hypothetical protein